MRQLNFVVSGPISGVKYSIFNIQKYSTLHAKVDG